MFAADNIQSTETTPMTGGSYKVTYYRNSSGACKKQNATEAIIHYHNSEGTLVHCEYVKLGDGVQH